MNRADGTGAFSAKLFFKFENRRAGLAQSTARPTHKYWKSANKCFMISRIKRPVKFSKMVLHRRIDLSVVWKKKSQGNHTQMFMLERRINRGGL